VAPFDIMLDMTEEIKENAIYTTSEIKDLLKISESTVKIVLKKVHYKPAR